MSDSIGDRVRAAREAANLSRAQLAALTDPPVSADAIEKIEMGLREDPRSLTVRSLARALGVSTDQLLCNECRKTAAA